MTVIGARPQLIKAGMVSEKISEADQLEEVLVHTGQHFDDNMNTIFFREMGIPEPKANLGISGGNHGAMTGRMLCELEKFFLAEAPKMVLVYGDTNSTIAAALAASKLHIPIAHVEGGLRNHDLTIPEEVNRVLTDRLSSIIYCPTELAKMNLLDEGFGNFPCQLVRTGDLMYDAAISYGEKLTRNPGLNSTEPPTRDPYILCTIHRALNTVQPGIGEVFSALNKIARNVRIVFPIHPRTQKALKANEIKLHSNILAIPPVGYLEMISLLKGCSRVITDSGGLQKEAYAFRKKSLILLDYTPWEELVTSQHSKTTEIDRERILDAWNELDALEPQDVKLYGDGDSAKTIINSLVSYLSC